MKKRTILLISVVIVSLGILEAAALMTRPKVVVRQDVPAATVEDMGGGSLGSTAELEDREPSLCIEALASALEIDEAVAHEKSLNMELVGTAIGNIKDARAFIKDLETGRQGIYKVGSTIRQAKVTRIAMGEVALELNGREELLRLSSKGRQWAQVSGSDSPITLVADNLYAVNRQELMHEAGAVLKAMQKVKVKPHYESNKICGLRVEGVPENSLIAAAGIKNSDVVTMVNSQKIDSYQKALQVMHKMKGQKEVMVSLLRNGQPQQIAYRIN